MNYVKIGFEMAIGWYLGKFTYDVIMGFANKMIEYHVPEKYWNDKHPDYPANRSRKSEAKMKIGFFDD